MVSPSFYFFLTSSCLSEESGQMSEVKRRPPSTSRLKNCKDFYSDKTFCEPALPELLAAGNILFYLEHPASANQCNAAKCKSNSQSKQTNTQNCKFHLLCAVSKLCYVIYCAFSRFYWSIVKPAGMQFLEPSNRMKTRAKVWNLMTESATDFQFVFPDSKEIWKED